jgi:hypothetical protein
VKKTSFERSGIKKGEAPQVGQGSLENGKNPRRGRIEGYERAG